jgi:hypothetical protein
MARRVIWRHSGDIPQMKRAGMVNNTPDATEELADPIVCDMFVSSMLCCRPIAEKIRKATTVSTATGIDVLIVNPAFSPK